MSNLDYNLMPVEQPSGEPVFQRIAALIIKNIEMQIIRPGDKLPTEREMAGRFGVARGTVKAAYRRLEQQRVIHTRQGSGSFVLRDEKISHRLQREKAAALMTGAITNLKRMGLKPIEIERLFDACLAKEPGQVISIAILHDSAELLLDFKRQLSFLPSVAISIFSLDTAVQSNSPENLLRGFDLIIVPTDYYDDFTVLAPRLAEKIINAAIAPSSETLISISSLSRSSRIGIICRTNAFLANVKEMLLSYGFLKDRILSFFEMDYTTKTYFPGGINVLISFSDAHIFTNPDFKYRNEEFFAKGGKIITFRHQLERGTFIYIEDRVRRLASSSGSDDD